VFRERLRAAMRIPVIEAAFAHPWTAAARRVLPSPSPQFTATAMWGPLLGWCVLELLAESIDAENPERKSLDLFDRLRLREPLGQAFGALGFDGEEGWRVAARIKVVLLSEAGIGKDEVLAVGTDVAETEAASQAQTSAVAGETSKAEVKPVAAQPGIRPAEAVPSVESVALAPALWLDPDVRWLTGVHEAEGHAYLVRERYEELLWWLLMPALLRLAGEPVLDRAAIARMGRMVDEALASAEEAGYRIDVLLGTSVEEADADEAADEPEAELKIVEPEPSNPEEPETEEPEFATADNSLADEDEAK
jgi:hypothetical protein